MPLIEGQDWGWRLDRRITDPTYRQVFQSLQRYLSNTDEKVTGDITDLDVAVQAAQAAALAAHNAADAAQQSADDALVASQAALAAAQDAADDAASAQSAADAADTKASAAIQAAQDAEDAADQALLAAAAAESAAQSAAQTADDAQDAADQAMSAASDALVAAGNAETAASNALSAAGSAQSSANAALAAANAAQQAADDAQDAADQAQSTADQAILDAAAAWQAAVDAHNEALAILPITETKIANDAVTAPKIAANAVVASKIDAGAVVAGKIGADAVTANNLAAVNLGVGKFIRSNVYTPGSAGWSINAAGDAEFNNVTVRGTVSSSAVTGSTITGSTITGGTIQTSATNPRVVIDSTATTRGIRWPSGRSGELSAAEVIVDPASNGETWLRMKSGEFGPSGSGGASRSELALGYYDGTGGPSDGYFSQLSADGSWLIGTVEAHVQGGDAVHISTTEPNSLISIGGGIAGSTVLVNGVPQGHVHLGRNTANANLPHNTQVLVDSWGGASTPLTCPSVRTNGLGFVQLDVGWWEVSATVLWEINQSILLIQFMNTSGGAANTIYQGVDGDTAVANCYTSVGPYLVESTDPSDLWAFRLRQINKSGTAARAGRVTQATYRRVA